MGSGTGDRGVAGGEEVSVLCAGSGSREPGAGQW